MTRAARPEDLADVISDLGARYVSEYARAVQRYVDVLDAAADKRGPASDPNDRQAAQSRYARFVVDEVPHVISALSEATLRYYVSLAELGVNTLNGYVESVVRPDGDTASGKTPTTSVRTLVFHGVLGQTASNAFMVTNDRDAPVEVSFETGEVTALEGEATFRPAATFSPPSLKLAPRAGQVVRCDIELDERFEAPSRYDGAITVAGCPDMNLRYSLTIEPPPQESTASASAEAASARRTSATGASKGTRARTDAGGEQTAKKRAATSKRTAKKRAARKTSGDRAAR